MTVYISNAGPMVRSIVRELRYYANDAFQGLNSFFANELHTSIWQDRSLSEQIAALPPEHREVFRDLVKKYIRAFLDLDQTTTNQGIAVSVNAVGTTEEVRASVDFEVTTNIQGIMAPGWNSFWVSIGERYLDLDGVLDRMRQASGGDTSHYTAAWSAVGASYPDLHVTLDTDIVPINLRRYLREEERSGSVRLQPAVRRSGHFATLGPRGGIIETTVAFNWRGSTTGRLLALPQLTEELSNRRAAHRAEVLANLPGYRAQREQERLEERLKEQRLDQSASRYINFRRNSKPDDKEYIKTLPFVGHGVLSSRRWGIEIETGAGRDMPSCPDQWDYKDDGSLESAYGDTWVDPEDCQEYSEDHTTLTMEVQHNNGSWINIPNPDFVDPRYCDYCGEVASYDSDDCVEAVSPILKSMHSRGLEAICDAIEFAPRTESAGIHVHVEAKDLTVAQVKDLVLAYDRIEHLLEASYDRVERGYCKRRSAEEVLHIARQEANSLEAMRKGDRYVTVNLNALSHHGTIEFRAMGPKYNYDLLVRWAMFCREMVNTVKNGATAREWSKVGSWNGVLKMFSKYGIEYNLAVGVSVEALDEELVEV